MGTKTNLSNKNALVIVAHPDDETLWCGGTILTHPYFNWYVISLSRGDDIERAPKFHKCLKILQANGAMGELDDSPKQKPLDNEIVKKTILSLLPNQDFDLIITHNPSGEYTRHLRHEEVSRAVLELWYEKKISTTELWTFAYEDGNKEYFSRAEEKAFQFPLPEKIWKQKYALITETYGFPIAGFEAETTPKIEAFWKFKNPEKAYEWLQQVGRLKKIQ
ncbi:PIG-L deacetylase family protein [Salegentibacter sp. Hel_I_6]|uniref:PIG-L deacetylase family protein n=1 Tax=Salegentibacter sp. Hel_I_6 TaxID=1250278 RepID=UPI0005635F5F|nr:PIG-L family deacetylase [Salegentibacter sp. Hel_I_6]